MIFVTVNKIMLFLNICIPYQWKDIFVFQFNKNIPFLDQIQ